MTRILTAAAALLTLALSLLPSPPAGAAEGVGSTLVLYSGRSQSLVEPVIALFEKETGTDVQVRYGETAELAALLLEEKDASQADLFWAQDAGALGALAQHGRLCPLPDSLQLRVAAPLRGRDGLWIATSGRARVLAYSTQRVKAGALPRQVFDLAQPQWKDRVGWAPTNGSFQSFVTALRRQHGDEKARVWLEAMRKNGARSYPSNTPLVRAIADGEIDVGLTNHYYVARFRSQDGKFPVQVSAFQPGDAGNLVNVAGVAIRQGSPNLTTAQRFIEFLLSPRAQQYFTTAVHEYPVVEGTIANPHLIPFETLLEAAPPVDLDDLSDLDGTVRMLRAAGLI